MKTLSSGNCTFSVPAKNSYRMVVLGASRVGKSSIVSRFLNGRFEDQYTPTIEDFHRKVYNIRGDMYQLDILDTSGNHPFPAMRRLSILTGGCWAGLGAAHVGVCARRFTAGRAFARPSSEMKVTEAPCAVQVTSVLPLVRANVGARAQIPSVQLWIHFPGLQSGLPNQELTDGLGMSLSWEHRGCRLPPEGGDSAGLRGPRPVCWAQVS